MADKIDDTRKAYFRQWRANNKEKVKQYNDRYWIRRAMREQMQQKEMQKHDGDNKAIPNN